METVYSVYVRPYNIDSEDDSILLGIYTTRSLALEVSRKFLHENKDNEFSIFEHHLNQSGLGVPIWCNSAECDPANYAHFYQRFWPLGFPHSTHKG